MKITLTRSKFFELYQQVLAWSTVIHTKKNVDPSFVYAIHRNRQLLQDSAEAIDKTMRAIRNNDSRSYEDSMKVCKEFSNIAEDFTVYEIVASTIPADEFDAIEEQLRPLILKGVL